jgi:hypothetical protein
VSREKVLFRTHSAPFQAPEWAVGSFVDHQGTVYKVTRWNELRPVSLARGGMLREWEVYGRKASSREVSDDLMRGLEALLRDEDEKD